MHRVQRTQPGRPPGWRQPGRQREQHRRRQHQRGLDRGGVQAEGLGEQVGQQRPGGARDRADQQQLAQDQPEHLAGAPADAAQRADLAAPGPHRGERGLPEEQRADHQHQDEQHRALGVDGGHDAQRHALLGPALADPQSAGQRDGLRRGRAARGDVHDQVRVGGADRGRDRVHPGPRGGVDAGHARHPDPDGADRRGGLRGGVEAAGEEHVHGVERGEQRRRLAEEPADVAVREQGLAAERGPARGVGAGDRRGLVGVQRDAAERGEPVQLGAVVAADEVEDRCRRGGGVGAGALDALAADLGPRGDGTELGAGVLLGHVADPALLGAAAPGLERLRGARRRLQAGGGGAVGDGTDGPVGAGAVGSVRAESAEGRVEVGVQGARGGAAEAVHEGPRSGGGEPVGQGGRVARVQALDGGGDGALALRVRTQQHRHVGEGRLALGDVGGPVGGPQHPAGGDGPVEAHQPGLGGRVDRREHHREGDREVRVDAAAQGVAGHHRPRGHGER